MKRAYRDVVEADAVRGCRFLKKIAGFYCCLLHLRSRLTRIFELLACISCDSMEDEKAHPAKKETAFILTTRPMLTPAFPNVPYLFSTFHKEYPSLLSRFDFVNLYMKVKYTRS